MLCFLRRKQKEKIVMDKMIMKTFGKCVRVKYTKEE